LIVHVVGFDLHLGRARLDLSSVDIELRSVPRALHRAAHQHAVRERSSFVRAAVLKRGVSLPRAADGDALPADMNQLHLVHLETATHRFERVSLLAVDTGFLPLARVGVAMVHSDLVPIGQRASHPAGGAQCCGSRGFQRKRQSAPALPISEP
jgi:hypothetical protein